MAKGLSQEDSLSEAFKRWELAALDESGRAAGTRVQLPTAEALEDIHRQAHQEGYELGYKDGEAAGYQQGAAKAQEEAQRLHELLDSVDQAIQQFGKETSEELLSLALEIARQMLRQALKVKPELLLEIIRNAMESIPPHAQHPHLHLHPEDAALAKLHLQPELSQGGWRIVEDAKIARGGCRIETTAAEVDATLSSRWQRLTAMLGSDSTWLDDDGSLGE